MPVRFSEPIRQAKAAVDEGKVGDLKAIVGTNILQQMAADTWFTDLERSGGGAIMDYTVHVVDLARWITGREVTEVYAEVGSQGPVLLVGCVRRRRRHSGSRCCPSSYRACFSSEQRGDIDCTTSRDRGGTRRA